MAAKKLQVQLVSPERELWAGEGDMVIASTLEGEIGIMPGHTPLLALLAPSGVVRIIGGSEEGEITAAVHSGFMSVSEDSRVSILAEIAELGEEIDVERAQQALESGLETGLQDGDGRARVYRARGRLRAAKSAL